MDKLQQMIETRRDAVKDLERKLSEAKRELEVFEQAARLRPLPAAERLANEAASESVRQDSAKVTTPVGVMSPQWIKTLKEMASNRGRRYLHSEIFDIAKRNDFSGTISSCRDRVRSYLDNGNLKGDSVKGFFVTDSGRNRVLELETHEEPMAESSTPQTN